MPAGASRGKGRVFRPGPGRRFQDFISLFSPNPENLQVFSKPRPPSHPHAKSADFA